jgi:16S rRNA (guanine966-N2)-methyltransferase
MPMPTPPRSPRARTGRQQLRIIGGQWRGRKLDFPALEGLRPTTDRLRETLFNWLQADIPGSQCLDLFAGSGALGLEALSRGAAGVTFVDQDTRACRQIRQHLDTLSCTRGRVQQARLPLLPDDLPPADIIFMDPPFGLGLAGPCLDALRTQGRLAQAWLYLETEPAADFSLQLQDSHRLHREVRTGQVLARLYNPFNADCA